MYKETQPYEIEADTASNWLDIGTIWPVWYGTENTYYMDQFDREYFAKNYPDLYGDPAS